MTGNDHYSRGPRQERYDQYGRPLPQDPPQAASASRPPAYPGGPLSLPDETSIYVYGETPDGYTQVAPAVPPPEPRRRSTTYRGGQPHDAGQQGYAGQGYQRQGYAGQGYAGQGYPAQQYPTHQPAPARPLRWQEVLGGLVGRPHATLDRARDQAFWWPALVLSAVCGVLAMVANDAAREQVVTSTLSTSVPAMLITAVVVPAFCVVLGWVSHSLARSLGGNGEAGPFITLLALVTWIADAPRLVVSLFANDDSSGLVALGLASFALTAWLVVQVAMRVHELAWHKALGSVSVQLIALLLVLKLPLAE
ncbi:MAG: hypothetical protein HOV68_19015 [Streptomycetaceae bacterium]|nr:hypothetical protein [Streptomycetaceae bacterium]